MGACDTPLVYRMAFALLRGMTPLMARELLARVGSEEAFFCATEQALGAMTGLRNRMFDKACREAALERARSESAFVARSGIRPLYFTDEAYPASLLECDDAPLLLYTLGSAPLSTGPMLSVVGTRHATPYGLDFVERLVSAIAEKVAVPVTIVSGLAFGIDIAGHRAAMRHGLPTVAVLAHGLDMIYPAAHRQAAADMVRGGGALVTEYPSSAPVHKGNFVARNRIVAGMCHALVVVESAVKGGALITAHLAADYHRDVFALPGRTSDRYSAGCNQLIARNVAALVQTPEELIEAMDWPVKAAESRQEQLLVELSPEQQSVVDFIERHGEGSVNGMSVRLNIPVGRLMSVLIDMELHGMLLSYPGGKYRLAVPGTSEHTPGGKR
ncbi:MAG: DNA-processing protein DprA [Muribaculaceae bacterium]|nr:DNA-processing protein DprA [Muribaculaceae bacterium]